MNQDQVKERLLMLEPDVPEFSLVFSGKTSKKVNGLYKPETREIIIHNRNFHDDNGLIYTAIHEFAHHIHFSSAVKPVSTRSHTVEFRSIFHRLLVRAEEKQVYLNLFDSELDFKALTKRIREKLMTESGTLLKELGKALMEARELCDKYHARFEDYIERVLCMSQNSAVSFIKMQALNVNPEIGIENMKTVAGIRDEGKRARAEEALLKGESPDMVKASLRIKEDPPSKVDILLKERARIEKTIHTLQEKLETLENRIREYEGVEQAV